MKPLGEILSEVDALEVETRKQIEEKRGAIEAGREDIIAGKDTTGNELHDGLIALYGAALIDEPQIVQNYESVASELIGKIGEPFIAVKRFLVNTEEVAVPHPGWEPAQAIHHKLFVGVLSGEEILWDKVGQISYLPTNRYVWRGENSWGSVEKKKLIIDKRFSIWHDFQLGIDLHDRLDTRRVLQPIGRTTSDDQMAMSLAIGRKNIERWLSADSEKNSIFPDIYKLSVKLNIPPIEPANYLQQRSLMNREAAP